MESTVPSVFFVALSHLKKFTGDGWTQWLFRYIASTLLERMTGKVFWHKDCFIPMVRRNPRVNWVEIRQWISYYVRQVGDISQVMAGISESNSIGTHGFEEKRLIQVWIDEGWRHLIARMVLTCSFCTCLFCPPRSSCHLGVCFTRVPFCTFLLGEFCGVPVCWPDSGNSQHKAKDIVRSKPNLP